MLALAGLAVIVHGLPALRQGDADPNSLQADCVAISINVNDYWCQTMCPTGQCPEDMCKCGAEAAALKASPAPGTQSANFERLSARDVTDGGVPLVIVGEDNACKSKSDSASDEWCTSTCKDNKANCPTMCECSDDTMEVVTEDPIEAANRAAEKAAKDAANAASGVAAPVAPVAPVAPKGPATVAGDFSMCKSLTLAATNEWCVHSCETGNCPATICTCDKDAKDATAAAAPAAVPAPAVPAVPAQPSPVAAPAAVPAPAVPAVPQLTAPVPEVSPVAVPVQAPAPVAEPATAAAPVAPEAPVAPTNTACKAISNAATDDWCALTCGAGAAACPETLCKCDAATSPAPSK